MSHVTLRCKNPYFKGSPHGVKFTPETGGARAQASSKDADKILKDYPNSMYVEAVEDTDPGVETGTDQEPDQEPVIGGHSGIEVIKGIGPKTADELAAAGIRTVEELAKASTEDVMKAAGVKQNVAFDWHLQANEIMSQADDDQDENKEDA